MKKTYLVWGDYPDDVDYGGVEFFSDEVWENTCPFGGPIYKTVEDYLNDRYENWKRVPDCDDWAEAGKAPVGYLIQYHNWYLGCYQCERRVNEEAWDDELEVELNPVYRGRVAFCCLECEKAYDAEREAWRSRIEEAKRYVKERWPFVGDISGGYSPDGSIWFYVFVPGLSRCVDWSSKDSDHVTVWCQADAEVWKNLTNFR